ncbi:MAG: hypothetical protein HKN76_18445 [Saprospiraceae bacterium]|nr:hypothetical protein [Saprospiraceae bacterium]
MIKWKIRRQITALPGESLAIKMAPMVGLFFLISIASLFGQDEPQRVYMYLDYLQSNENKYLIAEIKYREDGTFYQIADEEISFWQTTDTSELELGRGKTEKNGKIKLLLDPQKAIWDTSGLADFEARYAGNENFRSAGRSVTIKEIELTLAGTVEDSINTLQISGVEKLAGDSKDIEEVEIGIFVKRLFSDLPIKQGDMEEGSLSIEFPSDLPGDEQGNLLVIARITEHDDFGTVETSQNIQWGVPAKIVRGERPRALWSRAPIWIIFAVSAVFLAAWFHYFLSISKLFNLRKL